MNASIDVVIPAHNRPEIWRCIDSLNTTEVCTRVIIVGATAYEKARSVYDRLELEQIEFGGDTFERGAAINEGIRLSQAELILVSDADIIWSTTTLRLMRAAIRSHVSAFATVATVVEEDQKAVSLCRRRYTYSLSRRGADVKVRVHEQVLGATRPGSGLVMALRSSWLDVGGYVEGFRGWGWEDRDLAIRAELLGYRLCPIGQVTHLSHGDQLRNQCYGAVSPESTRNRNIIFSAQRLRSGKLKGDLTPNGNSGLTSTVAPIDVTLPLELRPNTPSNDVDGIEWA